MAEEDFFYKHFTQKEKEILLSKTPALAHDAVAAYGTPPEGGLRLGLGWRNATITGGGGGKELVGEYGVRFGGTPNEEEECIRVLMAGTGAGYAAVRRHIKQAKEEAAARAAAARAAAAAQQQRQRSGPPQESQRGESAPTLIEEATVDAVGARQLNAATVAAGTRQRAQRTATSSAGARSTRSTSQGAAAAAAVASTRSTRPRAATTVRKNPSRGCKKKADSGRDKRNGPEAAATVSRDRATVAAATLDGTFSSWLRFRRAFWPVGFPLSHRPFSFSLLQRRSHLRRRRPHSAAATAAATPSPRTPPRRRRAARPTPTPPPTPTPKLWLPTPSPTPSPSSNPSRAHAPIAAARLIRRR